MMAAPSTNETAPPMPSTPNAKQDEGKSRIVHRQKRKRVKAEQKTDRADGSGDQRARIHELEDQSIDADQH
jgi:hypothetical protein